MSRPFLLSISALVLLACAEMQSAAVAAVIKQVDVYFETTTDDKDDQDEVIIYIVKANNPAQAVSIKPFRTGKNETWKDPSKQGPFRVELSGNFNSNDLAIRVDK